MYLGHTHFIMGGRRYDDSRSFSESAFSDLHVGDKIPGRTSPVLYLTIRFQNEQFIGPPAWSDGPLIIPILISIVWNGIVGIFAYRYWFIPFLQRRLIRSGSVAYGVVTSYRSVGRGRRKVTYSFEIARGKLFVGSQELESGTIANAGMPCTVFYNPSKSSRSIIYELSGLEIVR
jgi:hypothetical protein